MNTPAAFNPEDLAQELLSRRQGRVSLLPFIRYTMHGYEEAPHHALITAALERVEAGKTRRLIIETPPRHGKSMLVSRNFPAWYLGRHPDHQVIHATYNAEFAVEFGRDVRNIVSDEPFQKLFDVELAADSKAANRWATNHGGQYIAAGVGSGLTGRGGHLILIDDPIKSREEADSELTRDRLYDWYRSVLYTRQMPNAAICLIQTRWHDGDLVGRLLQDQEEGGEKWERITLPARSLGREHDPLLREKDAPLWPAWFGDQALKAIEATVGAREWSALYQQQPMTEEGAYFKAEWFKRYVYDEVMNTYVHNHTNRNYFRIYGASDYAVTDGGGDYTVHIVVGVDPYDQLYILDVWREQADPDIWIDQVIDMMARWKPITWAEESGQIIKGLGSTLSRRMRERRVYCNRQQFASTRAKDVRARAIQARMAMGNVFFPTRAPWLTELEWELSRFPYGQHDDQADVLSLIGRMLDDMHGGRALPVDVDDGHMPATTMGEMNQARRRRRRFGYAVREAPIVNVI